MTEVSKEFGGAARSRRSERRFAPFAFSPLGRGEA